MLYTRLLITLLAAAIVSARPQDDVDILEELPEELTIVDGEGPGFDIAKCTEPGLAVGSGPCNPGFNPCNKGCAVGGYCPVTNGNCVAGCEGDKSCPTATPVCKDSTHTCVQCTKDKDCKNVTGKPVCNTGTNLCEAAPAPECTGSGATDTCPATKYCKAGTCTSGCKNAASATADCPTSTTNLAPLTCVDHVCKYSSCTKASAGPPAVLDTCLPTGTCTTKDGLNKCVLNTPTVTKCNAYKKCSKGFYCHNKTCKEGCDGGKYSACKDKDGKKGNCDGKHKCVLYTAKQTGAPCKKDKDCDTSGVTKYKCVRDHGHDSHCHKVAKKTEACNQKVLFPDVCDKHLVCKKGKCEEEKHKKNKYD